ncbi:hypothetical protein NSQ26_05345 [Bacillus sp. FSL W7-1360]
MTNDIQDIIEKLRDVNAEELLDLIEDAKTGKVEEVEIVPSIGLLVNLNDNKRLLAWLEAQGVQLIYVTDEDDREERKDES